MLCAASDLMRYRAVVDGAALPISDLFFSPDLARLQYLAVRKGPWPWAEHGVVNACHAGEPNTEDGLLCLSIRQHQLEGAPVVASEGPIERLAQKAARAEHEDDAVAIGRRVAAQSERVGDHLGSALVRDGEVVGRLDDLLIEWPRAQVRHIVANTGASVPVRQVVLPIDVVAEFDGDGDMVEVSATEEQIADAPEAHAFDALSRRGIDVMRNYYGL